MSYIGLVLFFIGASTVDADLFVGAVMVFAGMSMLVQQAKKEGMWR